MVAVTDSSSSLAIAVRDLGFSWSRRQPPLLNIPLLEVPRGERLYIYGPSGCGKSSLLNLLAGVNTADQGQIQILGQDLQALSQRRRDRFRARHIGVIFQQFNLIPYLSVLDNVLLAAHFARLTLPPPARRERALALLDGLGLSGDLATRGARHLSVGQQQRVAVARALISEPEILLADEPTSALDSDSRDAFMQVLLAVAERAGSTLVFVSHDRSLADHFDRSLDLRALQGEVVSC